MSVVLECGRHDVVVVLVQRHELPTLLLIVVRNVEAANDTMLLNILKFL
jgi:hypothetical protein